MYHPCPAVIKKAKTNLIISNLIHKTFIGILIVAEQITYFLRVLTSAKTAQYQRSRTRNATKNKPSAFVLFHFIPRFPHKIQVESPEGNFIPSIKILDCGFGSDRYINFVDKMDDMSTFDGSR